MAMRGMLEWILTRASSRGLARIAETVPTDPVAADLPSSATRERRDGPTVGEPSNASIFREPIGPQTCNASSSGFG